MPDEISEFLWSDIQRRHIREWWLGMPPEARPATFTLDEVAQQALTLASPTRAERISIGAALRRLGFLKQRVSGADGQCWVYRPTPFLAQERAQERGS